MRSSLHLPEPVADWERQLVRASNFALPAFDLEVFVPVAALVVAVADVAVVVVVDAVAVGAVVVAYLVHLPADFLQAVDQLHRQNFVFAVKPKPK